MDENSVAVAERVRTALAERARQIGSFHDISEATGVPYKSVYRYLGDGKDKVMPPFPFVVQLSELLRSKYDGIDFVTFYARAVDRAR